MKSRVMKLIVGSIASFLTLIAFSTSASACFISCYQPKEPKCIREE